jgi:subtilisin
MKYALLKASIVGFLIILPLLALMSTSSAQDSKVVRVVVGYEDEGVIGELATIPGIAIIKILRDLRAAVLLTPMDKLDLIKSLEGVRYVEEDGVAKALEISASSDVLWNVRMINATDVWDSYYDTYGWSALGKGIVIAVLDTGIDYRHPELGTGDVI